jgi:hypothetical protein
MKIKFIITALMFVPFFSNAQDEESAILFKTLKAKDSLLFAIGFNGMRCSSPASISSYLDSDVSPQS